MDAHLLLHVINFLHVLVEDVLADKLGSLELLATQWAEVLVLRQLLGVDLHEPLCLAGVKGQGQTRQAGLTNSLGPIF